MEARSGMNAPRSARQVTSWAFSFPKLTVTPQTLSTMEPATMSSSHVDVSMHLDFFRPASSKLIKTMVATSSEASTRLACDESPMNALGHHGSGAALPGDNDILDDWLDDNDDVLDWCMSLHDPSTDMDPRTAVCPPSPTAVDCIDLASTISSEQEQDVDQKFGFKLEADTSADSLAGSGDDDDDDDANEGLMKKTDPFADISTLRDWYEDWILKETQRLRQRGYEQTYRKRKQGNLQAIRQEWLQLEMALSVQLQKKSRAYPSKCPANNTTLQQRSLRSLLKARSIHRDNQYMRTLIVWKELFALRNYTITEEEMEAEKIPEDDENIKVVPEEILRTKEQWAAIDHKIRGASVIRPYQPLRFEFQW